MYFELDVEIHFKREYGRKVGLLFAKKKKKNIMDFGQSFFEDIVDLFIFYYRFVMFLYATYISLLIDTPKD